MKKRLSAFLIMLLIPICLNLPVYAENTDDNALEWEEIKISDTQDLIKLADNCHLDTWSDNKYVILTNDIVIDDETFNGIVTFGGIFDGKGHTINNFNYKGSASYTGFFAYIQEGATVKDLNIIGKVDTQSSQVVVGGIAGENSGIIENCSFNGIVSGKDYIGGIAGINRLNGLIKKCSFKGMLSGVHFSGGIAGENIGNILNCVNEGRINTSESDTSISIDDINIENYISILNNDSDNPDKASTDNGIIDTGGIAGYSTGVIQNCINNGEIGYEHIGYNIGGIVGRQSGYINDCINNGTVHGRKDVGGIAGQAEPYISIDLSKDIAYQLSQNIEQLRESIDRILSDAGEESDTISKRLTLIQQFTNSALEDSRFLADSTITYSDSLGSAANDIFSRADYIIDESSKKDGVFDKLKTSASDVKDSSDKLKDTVNDLDIYEYLSDSEKTEYDSYKKTIDDSSKEYEEYVRLAQKPYYNYYIFSHAGDNEYNSEDPYCNAKNLAFSVSDSEEYVYNTVDINNPADGKMSASAYNGHSSLGPDDIPLDSDKFIEEYGKDGEWVHHDDDNATDNAFPSSEEGVQHDKDLSLASNAAAYSSEMSVNYADHTYKAAHSGMSYSTDISEAASGIIKLTEAHMSEMSQETRSDASEAVEKLGSAADNIDSASSQTDGIVKHISELDNISVPALSEDYRAHTFSLTSNLQGMNDNFGYLNTEMNDASDKLIDDLEAVSDRFYNIMMLYTDAVDGVLEQDYTSAIQDDSFEVAETSTDATISDCSNNAIVNGDLNVAGIAGTMAIEYDFDLESDVTGIKDSRLNTTFRTKCVLRQNTNKGIVTAEKSYVGGICGLQEMGTVLRCSNYEEISSNSGSYIGGISGTSLSYIVNCYSKSLLSGTEYVGGIAGDGTNISDCISLVTIDDAQRWYGGIAGHVSADAKLESNIFVSDTLSGIDRISYSDKAEPVTYKKLMSLKEEINIPSQFDRMRVVFVLDDPESPDDKSVLNETYYKFGDKLTSIENEIRTDKTGFYYTYDIPVDEPIHSDMKIGVIRKRFKTTLAAVKPQNKQQSSILIDGQFKENDFLDAVLEADIDSESEKEGIIETWNIVIPDDGQKVHQMRYLPGDGFDNSKLEKLGVYVFRDNKWVELQSTGKIGKYYTYDLEGNNIRLRSCIKNIHRLNRAMIIGIALTVIIIIAISSYAFKFISQRRKKIRKAARKITSAAIEAAQNIGSQNQLFYHGDESEENDDREITLSDNNTSENSLSDDIHSSSN